MPSIGVRQASMEYYLSNLTWNSFHTYNCLTGAMDCQSYDERTAGKGADAMCSLRLWYYLHVSLISTQRPEHLIFIMGNCVGQNKSQDVMKFYALMSAVFYTTVTIIFLPPGHSHNAADRCHAILRNNLRGRDIYSPPDIATIANRVTISTWIGTTEGREYKKTKRSNRDGGIYSSGFANDYQQGARRTTIFLNSTGGCV